MKEILCYSNLILVLVLGSFSNIYAQSNLKLESEPTDPRIKTTDVVMEGAENIDEYIDRIRDKSVAVVANHTSIVGSQHLVDTLLSLGVEIAKIFSPEHGFRGTAGAGEAVSNEKDRKTGLQIISLYGDNKKPKLNQLIGVDVIIFDLQDVGTRFYTYSSTLFYVMQACTEADIELIVLDRPNPNGFYIDGPMLEDEYSSFVGLCKVPLVHGLTMGELAQMINGEDWLFEDMKCDLTVVPCGNYSHRDFYQLPVAPSPNLPNMDAVYLYPSLALFEGTVVSVGRGTDFPFQVYGHPDFKTNSDFSFTPSPNEGAAFPKLDGQQCYGFEMNDKALNIRERKQLNLSFLMQGYSAVQNRTEFFLPNNFFNLLAGNNVLMEQIKSGLAEDEIKAGWQKGIHDYIQMRNKYLLYPDFKSMKF